jgi:hypothetical protein
VLFRSGPVRWIGLDDAAFSDDAFLVLRGASKRRVRVAVPLERAGAACEIVCERGTGPVPLLVPLVNLAALARGVLPLHASAFRYRGTGVVVTGWTKGGKTEALLAFMENGAEYVGDEWVYVAGEGTRVFGLAEPIRLWGWHVSQLPARAALLRRSDRMRLRVLGAVDAADERLRGWRGRPRILDRSFALARAQVKVDVEPERLFGDRRRPEGVPFDRLVFVVGRDAPEIDVVAADPLDVARRMVFSLQHERRPLLDAYRKFRFAFPQAANGFLDDVASRELDLATRFFADKPTFAVYHPYPLSFVELFDAMEPYCR